MALLISSLYCGYEKIEELDRFIRDNEGAFGGEYTFKNDREYIKKLEGLLFGAPYDVSIHGPLIDAEPSAPKGSKEYESFIEAYEKTFETAIKLKARHIVYHTSYLPYKKEDIKKAFDVCYENTAGIVDMAKKAGVKLLVENLPTPPGGLSLIDNDVFQTMVENIGADVIIDTGHANITGFDVEKFVAKNFNKVKAYHFHNNSGKGDTHRGIFDGSFDFDMLEKVYKKYTCGADIIIEYKPTNGLSYEDIKNHSQYIKNKFLNNR